MTLLRRVSMAAVVTCLACGSGASTAADGSPSGGDDATADGPSSTPEAGGAPAGDETTDAVPDARPSPDGAREANASTSDAGCAAGALTFQIQPAPNSRSFCVEFSTPASTTWVTVRPADSPQGDRWLPVDPCESLSTCGACTCNGGHGYQALAGTNARITWDGTYFVSGTGSCGRCAPCGQCVTQGCAPPGSYVATFCAYLQTSTGCDTSTTVCGDVPFDWPPSDGGGLVVGLVGP